MSILFLILKWLSQLLIVTSGIYGMFSDLYKEDEHTKKRKLTRAGVINLATLLIGLLLFGITDFQERQTQKDEANAKLEAAKKEAEFQIKTNGLLNLQIESQKGELRYLRHLILVQELVEGWEFSWKPQMAVMRLARSHADSLHGADDAYLRLCLRGEVSAHRAPNGHWMISCSISRPFGTKTVSFDLAPSQPQWEVFESTLDELLSPVFSIYQSGGEDILVLTRFARPDDIVYSENRIVVTVRSPGVKLSRFEEPIQAVLRMDVDQTSMAPDSIRMRSLDPNLHLDQMIRARWRKQQIGTKLGSAYPGEEPPQVPVYAIFSGPHELKGTFNKLLFAFDKDSGAAPQK